MDPEDEPINPGGKASAPKNKTFQIVIAVFLLAILVSMIYFGFFVKSEKPPVEIPPTYYKCGNTLVPFRANITDCQAFAVEPGEDAFEQLALNPLAGAVLIMIEPDNSTQFVSSYEISKTFTSLLIPSLIGFSSNSENNLKNITEGNKTITSTKVPVISIENATVYTPLVWLHGDQDKNLITVSGNVTSVYAKTTYDLDAAACRLAIIAINNRFDCAGTGEEKT